MNGSAKKIAGLVSTFIEDQKNKDLLDVCLSPFLLRDDRLLICHNKSKMPRTRQLNIPIMLRDDGASVPVATTEDSLGGLLALDIDSDVELIHQSHLMTHVTKFWLSSHGGIGCFATGFHEVLTEIAAVTGTNITIIDEVKGIQISGSSAGDVDDAVAKLTRIEKPLVRDTPLKVYLDTNYICFSVLPCQPQGGQHGYSHRRQGDPIHHSEL